jgi:hypothetical protein
MDAIASWFIRSFLSSNTAVSVLYNQCLGIQTMALMSIQAATFLFIFHFMHNRCSCFIRSFYVFII